MSRAVGTVVVGAGPAGLATSAHLAAAGHDHVVLERGRVGETWRTQRWDSFRLDTPPHLSGLPVTAGHPSRVGAAEVVAALEERAAGLPVHEGVAVRGVWRERGGGYLVATDEVVLRTRHVVAASGAKRVPRVPAVADRVVARGVEHLHAADYRSPAGLAPGAVLVVGAGRSGVQVALDLLGAGRRVLLATSAVGRLPAAYRGRHLAEWWRDMGRLDTPAAEVSAAVRRHREPLLGHSLQGLARAGVELVGRVAGASGARLMLAGDPVADAAEGDRMAQRHRARIDRWIARHALPAPPAEPDVLPLRRDEVPGRTTLDLHREGVTSVVWATGLTGDFAWLKMPILDPHGHPIHRGVETPSRGLFAVGVPWLTSRGSGSLYGIERDAVRVAATIVGSTVSAGIASGATGRENR